MRLKTCFFMKYFRSSYSNNNGLCAVKQDLLDLLQSSWTNEVEAKKHIDSRKLSIENRIVRIILLFSVQNSKKTSKMTFENIERMSRLLCRTENFFIGDKIWKLLEIGNSWWDGLGRALKYLKDYLTLGIQWRVVVFAKPRTIFCFV